LRGHGPSDRGPCRSRTFHADLHRAVGPPAARPRVTMIGSRAVRKSWGGGETRKCVGRCYGLPLEVFIIKAFRRTLRLSPEAFPPCKNPTELSLPVFDRPLRGNGKRSETPPSTPHANQGGRKDSRLGAVGGGAPRVSNERLLRPGAVVPVTTDFCADPRSERWCALRGAHLSDPSDGLAEAGRPPRSRSGANTEDGRAPDIVLTPPRTAVRGQGGGGRPGINRPISADRGPKKRQRPKFLGGGKLQLRHPKLKPGKPRGRPFRSDPTRGQQSRAGGNHSIKYCF